jgi:formylglycine-generating enzyme required for sulfatase activity/tRNA A-37 threonylcarbamoyl transferase component Bud32
MPAEAVEPFLSALRGSNLLDPARFRELTAWAYQTRADTQAIAAELLRRRWLTPYQVREVHRGRGAGLTLGRYILLDLIGEGGMGRVHKARDARLGREVALKIIRREKLARPETLRRFHREMEAAGKLSHPNVVLALDAGEVNGTHFIAMEYVEGIDLTRLVQQRGPLAIPQACDYIRQAALGLQHAADLGLVHRDVKPSNLLVTPRGQVKVLDLGLALLKGEPGGEGANRVTQAGLVLGTPDFLAPEQARDPLGVDTRADVYALGATLYYLLTGRVPFDGPTPADKLVQHVTYPTPSAAVQRPDVPSQLDAVVRWMMAKRPEDRPQAPAQAALALAPFCVSQGYQVPEQPPGPVIEPVVRHRPASNSIVLKITVAVLAVLICTAAVIGVGYVLLGGLGEAAPVPADDFVNPLGMKMVRLPGGAYVMGSPKDEPGRGPSERTAGEVTVPGPFFISAHEVTHGEFLAIMGKSPAKHPLKRRNPARTPVDSVTWQEATEFCRRLTTRDAGRASGWGYRLPNESEWEYACRAGTTTSFWSGDRVVLGRHAIFDLRKELDAGGKLGEPDLSMPVVEKFPPYPVGSTEPNPFGLYDTHGNVWEWCADPYTGPEEGDWRVVRGGSWREPAARCRSAVRRGLDPSAREEDVGFRIVYAPVE